MLRSLAAFAAIFLCAAAVATTSATVVTAADYPYAVQWRLSVDRTAVTFTVTRRYPSSAKMRSEWFAIALHPEQTTMMGTDMLFAWMQPDGGANCSITDRWSYSGRQIPPPLDTDEGGTDDLYDGRTELGTIPGVDGGPTQLYTNCIFTRALYTGDERDHAIVPHRQIRLSVAYGGVTETGNFLKHDRTVRGTWVYFGADGGTGQFPPAAGQPRHSSSGDRVMWNSHRGAQLLFWHAALMVMAWFALMLPATYLARYLKAVVPGWFAAHWKAQALAVLAAIIGIILAIVAVDATAPNTPHVVLGFVVVALLPVQVLVGHMSNALWYEGKPPHWWPDKLHWWLGRSILLLGAVNVLLGVRLFGDAALDVDYESTLKSVAENIFIAMATITVAAFVAGELLLGQQHEYQLITASTIDDSAFPDISATADGGKMVHMAAARSRMQQWLAASHRFGQRRVHNDYAFTVGSAVSLLLWAVVAVLAAMLICVLCLVD